METISTSEDKNLYFSYKGCRCHRAQLLYITLYLFLIYNSCRFHESVFVVRLTIRCDVPDGRLYNNYKMCSIRKSMEHWYRLLKQMSFIITTIFLFFIKIQSNGYSKISIHFTYVFRFILIIKIHISYTLIRLFSFVWR